MKITQWICRGGSAINEDAFYQDENCAIVFDGSTSLMPGTVRYTSDVFIAEIIAAFSEFLKYSPQAALPEALKHAVSSVRAQYVQHTQSAAPQDIPASASVAAVRELNGLVEIYALGDCACVLHTQEGVSELYLDGVAKLDGAVIAKMSELHERTGSDISNIVRTPEIRQMLTANRLLMNTPDGYYILSFDESAIDHGLYLTMPAEKLICAYLFSDGFALARDAFFTGEALSLESLYADIRAREDADAGLNEYPRFKLHDDATAVEIAFDTHECK